MLADEFVCFQASDSFVSIRRVLNDYKDRSEIAKFTLSGLTVFHAGQSYTGGDNFDCSQWCVIVTQTRWEKRHAMLCLLIKYPHQLDLHM